MSWDLRLDGPIASATDEQLNHEHKFLAAWASRYGKVRAEIRNRERLKANSEFLAEHDAGKEVAQ
jgi:hypothetical protein